jgi:hypothetical protein
VSEKSQRNIAHPLAAPRSRPSGDPPHFLGIGAPRCGTSWTFKMLRLHPQLWMPWKEIHYFDSVDPGTDSGYAMQDRAFRLKLGWRYIAWRLALRTIPGARALARRYLPLQAADAPGYRWSARFLFGSASLAWYRGLFREGAERGLCCGEITPAYFMLSAPAITRLARDLDATRAFLILRNPLDWAWSGICKDARDAGLDPAAMTVEELIARCPAPEQRGRADFGGNLGRWLDCFPRERLFIGFYDDIEAGPLEFLERLCDFLGVSAVPRRVRELVQARVNSSARDLMMPAAVARHVAARFAGQAEIMAKLAGGPALRWSDRIRDVLRG